MIACARRLSLLPALMLGACTAAGDTPPGTIADADQVPPARVLREGERCIQSSAIQNTDVHGDQVIDFHMRNNRVYRSTLPNRCPNLGFEERFAYETHNNQLCTTDIITVLNYGAGGGGAGCILGEFMPVELIEEQPNSPTN